MINSFKKKMIRKRFVNLEKFIHYFEIANFQDIKDTIFNLKEISEKLGKNLGKKGEELNSLSAEPVDVPKTRSENTVEDVSSGFDSRTGSRGTILDDTSALDLHRSKSYIVNLIDRALSKELGTISNEEKGRVNIKNQFLYFNMSGNPWAVEQRLMKATYRNTD